MEDLRSAFNSSSSSSSREDPDLYGSVSSIPLEAVAPPASFIEDMGHRSLAMGGDAGVLRPPALRSFSSSASPALASVGGQTKVGEMLHGSASSINSKPSGGKHMRDASGASKRGGEYASLTPRALPPVDGFLEPNNHVFIRGTVAIAILIELLRELLARNHVDAHFSAAKCKWKAARSTAHSSVDFRITLYLCPKGNWCVEFQKRHGDFFLMRDLYEQFLTETDRKKIMAEGCAKLFKGMVEAQLDLDGLDSGLSPFDLGPDMYLPPPPLPLGLPPPPALNSGLGMDDDLAYLMGPCSAMHFEPLICMAQVRCPIARFEAAKSLAQLSNSEDNRAMMKEAGVIPVLVELLRKEDGHSAMSKQAKQAAVVALSNLSACPSCKASIVDSGAAPGLLELVSNPRPEDEATVYLELEMRREGARALANLCEEREDATRVVSMAGKEAVSDWLKSVDGLKDERLHMYACRIRRMVRSCC